MESRLLGALSAGIFLFLSTATSAALVDNGGGLIYDTVLDITWAQPDARRSWDDANNWASGLTLGGVSGWRLPYISVEAGAGPLTTFPVKCADVTELACRDNELGYMFYHNLSGTFSRAILFSDDPDLALFPTLQNGFYWSGTEFDSGQAWDFDFSFGIQFHEGKEFDAPYSWAVHAGNVIPVPAAVWLFASGLMGLLGIARRKR
jgi:hypothetical protein